MDKGLQKFIDCVKGFGRATKSDIEFLEEEINQLDRKVIKLRGENNLLKGFISDPGDTTIDDLTEVALILDLNIEFNLIKKERTLKVTIKE